MPLLLDEWQGRRFGKVRFRACLEQKGFWARVGRCTSLSRGHRMGLENCTWLQGNIFSFPLDLTQRLSIGCWFLPRFNFDEDDLLSIEENDLPEGRPTVSQHFCGRNAALDPPRLVFPFEGDQSRVKIFRVCSVSRRWRGRGITSSAADDVCLCVGLVFSFNHSVNIGTGSLGGSFLSQVAGSEYRSLCLPKASISIDGTG